MTHTLEPVTPSRDANALLALTLLLIVTTWSFFGRFSLFVAPAGIATAVFLHWWYLHHPAFLARSPARDRAPVINISAIHVGGDAAGLAFALGGVAIVVMGLPPLRWFVAASALLSIVFAVSVILWHRTHSIWSTNERLLTA
jgi:hypothetical protein